MSDLETPSEKLAKRVVARLIEAGLLRADKAGPPLASKIAMGEMNSDDWKLEIDLATTKVTKP